MKRPAAHIEIFEKEDGVYWARCSELGLSAEGASMQEAEAAVLRLIEERTDQLGTGASPPAIESERDTRFDSEE